MFRKVPVVSNIWRSISRQLQRSSDVGCKFRNLVLCSYRWGPKTGPWGKVWREWRLTLPKIPEIEQRSAGLAFKLDEFRTIAMQLL